MLDVLYKDWLAAAEKSISLCRASSRSRVVAFVNGPEVRIGR